VLIQYGVRTMILLLTPIWCSWVISKVARIPRRLALSTRFFVNGICYAYKLLESSLTHTKTPCTSPYASEQPMLSPYEEANHENKAKPLASLYVYSNRIGHVTLSYCARMV